MACVLSNWLFFLCEGTLALDNMLLPTKPANFVVKGFDAIYSPRLRHVYQNKLRAST